MCVIQNVLGLQMCRTDTQSSDSGSYRIIPQIYIWDFSSVISSSTGLCNININITVQVCLSCSVSRLSIFRN